MGHVCLFVYLFVWVERCFVLLCVVMLLQVLDLKKRSVNTDNALCVIHGQMKVSFMYVVHLYMHELLILMFC